jgi:hypothetical protein
MHVPDTEPCAPPKKRAAEWSRHWKVGSLVLDESIPDAELRRDIFARLPRTDMELLVEGCERVGKIVWGSQPEIKRWK